MSLTVTETADSMHQEKVIGNTTHIGGPCEKATTITTNKATNIVNSGARYISRETESGEVIFEVK